MQTRSAESLKNLERGNSRTSSSGDRKRERPIKFTESKLMSRKTMVGAWTSSVYKCSTADCLAKRRGLSAVNIIEKSTQHGALRNPEFHSKRGARFTEKDHL